ncbi:MAG: maleylacetate reductase [Burkholderiales bacterium]
MNNFVFTSPAPRVLFGRGTIDAVGRELDLHKIERAFILCGRSGMEAALRIVNASPKHKIEVLRLSSNAITSEDFDQAMQLAKMIGANGFIALGGGTPIGLGKSIAANTGMRYIGIPTTYSGSEMASNWTYGKGKDAKNGSGQAALPSTAIYDPDLTLGLPPVTSGQSGMNAMAHAVESLYGADRSPVVETQAEEAVRLLGLNLPRVVANPSDFDARSGAFYGAWLAAAFRAQIGVEHAIAQKVRNRYGLSHAGTHAVVVPYAIAFNRGAAPDAMERIERALGVKDAGLGLYDLNVRLGIPIGLKDLGLKESDIDAAAEFVGATPIANPRPVSRADLVELITQAFHGAPPRF